MSCSTVLTTFLTSCSDILMFCFTVVTFCHVALMLCSAIVVVPFSVTLMSCSAIHLHVLTKFLGPGACFAVSDVCVSAAVNMLNGMTVNGLGEVAMDMSAAQHPLVVGQSLFTVDF